MSNLPANTPEEEAFEEFLKDIELHDKYFNEIEEIIAVEQISEIKKQWGEVLQKFIGDDRKKFISTYKQEAKTDTKIDPATLSRLISGVLPKKASTLMPLILFVIKYKQLSEKQIYNWLDNLRWIYGKEEVEKLFLSVNLPKKGLRMRPVVKTSPWAQGDDFISPFIEGSHVSLVIVYGGAGCGKTQIAAQIAQRIESSYHFGIFWLSGKDLTFDNAIQYLANATPELIDIPKIPEQVAEQWKIWVENIPQKVLVILDEVPLDVIKFFAEINMQTLDLLITTCDRHQIEKIFSEKLDNREIVFEPCSSNAIGKNEFKEYVRKFDPLSQDWLLKVAMICDYHPEIVSKAHKIVLHLTKEDLAISPKLTKNPSLHLEFHLFARKILLNLTERQQELILAIADATALEKDFSINEASSIWRIEPDFALFILERFEALDLVISKATNKVYERKYRVHGVLVEACIIARKFNYDPKKFLLESNDFF